MVFSYFHIPSSNIHRTGGFAYGGTGRHMLTSRSSLLLFTSWARQQDLSYYGRTLFHLMPATFTPAIRYSYRTLVLYATSSTALCLICGFCTSGQMYALGFHQIPSHGGHPYLWQDASRYKGALGNCKH